MTQNLRDLECKIENSLEELEKISFKIDPDIIEITMGSSDPEEMIESSVAMLLDEFKYTCDQLYTVASNGVEQSKCNQHQIVYKGFLKRFLSIKSNIQNKRYQQKLMGNHLRDRNDGDKVDILIKESRSLDTALEMGRGILAAANEVKISLAYQKEKLLSSQDKIVVFAETLPGINMLLGRISRRKRFNAIVIGLAISVCSCITVAYMMF